MPKLRLNQGQDRSQVGLRPFSRSNWPAKPGTTFGHFGRGSCAGSWPTGWTFVRREYTLERLGPSWRADPTGTDCLVEITTGCRGRDGAPGYYRGRPSIRGQHVE